MGEKDKREGKGERKIGNVGVVGGGKVMACVNYWNTEGVI